MTSVNGFLQVGKINSPHGLDGKLQLRLFNLESQCLSPGIKVELRSPNSTSRTIIPATIASITPIPHKHLLRVGFVEIGDRNAAEALRGFSLWIQRSQLPPLAPDEFYLADTIGLRVERVCSKGGYQFLGRVVAITSNGAQDLLEVAWESTQGKQYLWLLPVLPQWICEINDSKIRVQVPIGLVPEPLEREAEDL